ncbi:hypothetical protein DFH27DRAFT_608321 [Peziza echinospora]|nr:hypothetical protein DFH27DRAFT_608321 [Peziza echinospora]
MVQAEGWFGITKYPLGSDALWPYAPECDSHFGAVGLVELLVDDDDDDDDDEDDDDFFLFQRSSINFRVISRVIERLSVQSAATILAPSVTPRYSQRKHLHNKVTENPRQSMQLQHISICGHPNPHTVGMNQQPKTIHTPAIESLSFGGKMEDITANGPYDGTSWDVHFVTDMLKFSAFVDDNSGEVVHGPGAAPIPGKPTPKPPPRPPTPYPHPEPDSEGLTFPEAPESKPISSEQEVVTALVPPIFAAEKTPSPPQPAKPLPPPDPRPITRLSSETNQNRHISTEPMSPKTGLPKLISEDGPRPRPRPGPLGPPPGPPPDYPPPPVPIPNGTKQIDSQVDTHGMAMNMQQRDDPSTTTTQQRIAIEIARTFNLLNKSGLTAKFDPETSRIEIVKPQPETEGQKSSMCSPSVMAPQNAFKDGRKSELLKKAFLKRFRFTSVFFLSASICISFSTSSNTKQLQKMSTSANTSMAKNQEADKNSNGSGLLVVIPNQPLIGRDMDDDEFAAVVENRRQMAWNNITVAEEKARKEKEARKAARKAVIEAVMEAAMEAEAKK